MNISWVVMSPHFAICVHDSALRTCEGGHPPFKRGVSQVERRACGVKCMGTTSIANGNVCGRSRDVLARKVLFCRYTNHVNAIVMSDV